MNKKVSFIFQKLLMLLSIMLLSIILLSISSLVFVSCDNQVESPESFTLSFNLNGGEGEVKAITQKRGRDFTVPFTVVLREGYEFSSWNTEADGSGDTYRSYQKIKLKSNLTLYAQWDYLYTISFDANGGEGEMKSANRVKEDDYIVPYCAFTKLGYGSVYWNTKADGSGTDYFARKRIKIKSNLHLYAQWEEKYDIFYVLDEKNQKQQQAMHLAHF